MYTSCGFVRDWKSGVLEMNQSAFAKICANAIWVFACQATDDEIYSGEEEKAFVCDAPDRRQKSPLFFATENLISRGLAREDPDDISTISAAWPFLQHVPQTWSRHFFTVMCPASP